MSQNPEKYMKRACESLLESSDDVKEDERFKLPRLYATQIVDLLGEEDDIVDKFYNNVLHCLYYYCCGIGAPKHVDARRVDNYLARVVVSNIYDGSSFVYPCLDECYHVRYVCAYRGFKSEHGRVLSGNRITIGYIITVDDKADESTWAYKYKHGQYGSIEIIYVRRIIDHVCEWMKMPELVFGKPLNEIDKDFTIRQRVKKDLWVYFGIVLDLETGKASRDLKEHGRVLCEFIK
jgi:hypothetical protein